MHLPIYMRKKLIVNSKLGRIQYKLFIVLNENIPWSHLQILVIRRIDRFVFFSEFEPHDS